ncbi:DUF4129 domain-containing protein [Dictyobacter kobayashii]|uniref:Protein-glutamine gamma-glutamyltransferase-like C-terminal domain-containing protein n=1 Tax=Dictyobacter kobayashii TaxID=2014872 RepID=A0A402AGZ4_9CHLR|nr:DUF4129 domain-containing protein [Dictyobacter kobayashii]GCE18324.1 hypothetical protein KDK_21240 [Dictyobacter kobayashii]
MLIALIITFITVIVILLRKRKIARRSLDIHESLWSWELFWLQLKTLLLQFWQRFSRQKDEQPVQLEERMEEEEEPIMRDVRAIYRAFLQWAASRGYRRQHAETPQELKQRLIPPLPAFEPEIQTVTEIYTSARYSHVLPDDAEIARMHQSWLALQRKSAEGNQ